MLFAALLALSCMHTIMESGGLHTGGGLSAASTRLYAHFHWPVDSLSQLHLSWDNS